MKRKVGVQVHPSSEVDSVSHFRQLGYSLELLKMRAAAVPKCIGVQLGKPTFEAKRDQGGHVDFLSPSATCPYLGPDWMAERYRSLGITITTTLNWVDAGRNNVQISHMRPAWRTDNVGIFVPERVCCHACTRKQVKCRDGIVQSLTWYEIDFKLPC